MKNTAKLEIAQSRDEFGAIRKVFVCRIKCHAGTFIEWIWWRLESFCFFLSFVSNAFTLSHSYFCFVPRNVRECCFGRVFKSQLRTADDQPQENEEKERNSTKKYKESDRCRHNVKPKMFTLHRMILVRCFVARDNVCEFFVLCILFNHFSEICVEFCNLFISVHTRTICVYV